MVGGVEERQAWKPWLRISFTKNPTSVQKGDFGNIPRKLVLFVRIVHEDKSDVFTLRDLQYEVKIYQIKAELELLSGIPSIMMEMYSIPEKSFDDEDSLFQGKNVSFGDTVRVHLNDAWNGLFQACWKGSVSDVKRYLNIAQEQLELISGLPSEHGFIRDRDYEHLLGTSLFIASRRGDEKLCKLLLKQGANGTYTTLLGNSCLHVSASEGHLSVIQLLVSHGANVRCHNIHNKSAIEVARDRGHIECARWLWLNQWSLSITKDMVNTIERPEISSKLFITPPVVPEPINGNSKENRFRGKSPSKNARSDTGRKTYKSNGTRPQTAYPLRSRNPTKSYGSVLPLRSFSARSNDAGTYTYPTSELPVFPTGKHKDKNEKIINFFISRKDRQQSIPTRYTTLNAPITNVMGVALSPRTTLEKERVSLSQARPRSAVWTDKAYNRQDKVEQNNNETNEEYNHKTEESRYSVSFEDDKLVYEDNFLKSIDGISNHENSYSTPPPSPNQSLNYPETKITFRLILIEKN
ncbi:uncharacterized protein LOC120334521 [Styela clava]